MPSEVHLSSSTASKSVKNNKIQSSKAEDLIGFIKGFMNQAASHSATTAVLQEWKVFYRKKGEARESLTKEKKGLVLGQDIFSLGEENRKAFYLADCLFFQWVCGWRGYG